jgi:hypothetical protein
MGRRVVQRQGTPHGGLVEVHEEFARLLARIGNVHGVWDEVPGWPIVTA